MEYDFIMCNLCNYEELEQLAQLQNSVITIAPLFLASQLQQKFLLF